APGRCAGHQRENYFTLPERVVKKSFRVVPIEVTPATIMIETRLAMRAYSMAVAPLRSLHRRVRADRAAWEARANRPQAWDSRATAASGLAAVSISGRRDGAQPPCLPSAGRHTAASAGENSRRNARRR